MSTMSKLTRAAVISCVAVSAIIGGSSIASANSFTDYVGRVKFSYNDAADEFRVTGMTNQGVRVVLTPLRKGRGPSYDESVTGAPVRDTRAISGTYSLKRAYEDTRYSATVTNGKYSKTVEFWS